MNLPSLVGPPTGMPIPLLASSIRGMRPQDSVDQQSSKLIFGEKEVPVKIPA